MNWLIFLLITHGVFHRLGVVRLTLFIKINKSNDTARKGENREQHSNKKSKTGTEKTQKTTSFSKTEKHVQKNSEKNAE
jgi:hypothetical protein